MNIKFLKLTAITWFLLQIFAISTVYAQGGNDPIPGIDIIIKRDPTSKPIRDMHFGKDHAHKLAEMDTKEANHFLKELLVTSLEKSGQDPSPVKKMEFVLTEHEHAMLRKNGNLDKDIVYRARCCKITITIKIVLKF